MDFKRILAALFLMMAVPCLVAEEASGTSVHLIQVFPSFSELIVGGGLPFLLSLFSLPLCCAAAAVPLPLCRCCCAAAK